MGQVGQRGHETMEVTLNDVALVLALVSVTNLWPLSELRARDLAILPTTLTVYDLIATSLLPLTSDLIARLARLPCTPMLAWPTGDGGWGLGSAISSWPRWRRWCYRTGAERTTAAYLAAKPAGVRRPTGPVRSFPERIESGLAPVPGQK